MRHSTALRSIDDTPREAPAEISEWEIEELSEVRERLGSGLSNRLLGALIAIAVGTVGFGFSGHWASSEPTSGPAARGSQAAMAEPRAAPASAPLLVLSAPLAGTRVDGSLVEVRGFARQPLGTVHLAVGLGQAVLGWTNLEVGGAGPISAAIRVFAPPFDLPVQLHIDSGTTPRGTGIAMTVELQLSPASGVTLWRSRLLGTRESWLVMVEGFGPRTTDVFGLEIRTASGDALATADGQIGDEAGRPGALGGRMLGLGSFTIRLRLDRPPPPGELFVILTWRDDSGGTTREIAQSVIRAKNPGSPPPHGAL